MKCSLVSLIFLKRSLVFPILLFSSISLHWSLRKAFLFLLAILWNSAFRCFYPSFSPLLFASLLFTAICKASILWRPTRPFRTNTPKRYPFHYRGLECKSRKSRNTWNNRQIWLWSTEWSRAKANRVFAKRTHWSLQTLFSNNTREDSTHGHHQMVNTELRLTIFSYSNPYQNHTQDPF